MYSFYNIFLSSDEYLFEAMVTIYEKDLFSGFNLIKK